MNRLPHIILILGLTMGSGFAAIFKVPGSQQNGNHTTANWTNDYPNTVVIQAATNKRRLATDYRAEILASSALLSAPQVIQSLTDSHPASHLFYYEVRYPGTVDFRVAASTNSTGISALYVLRSDTGAKIETASIRQHEQATRVPLMIAAPGFPIAQRTMAPAGLIDLYPTLCELAGLPLPEQPLTTGIAGHSLVPVLADPNARVQTGIVNHYDSNNFGYAYRTERYRFTEWINGAGNVLARELYDDEADPMETNNLADDPRYAALAYQFSRSTRHANEARGSERLKGTPPLPPPSNRALPGLTIPAEHVAWPDAIGQSYTLRSKTNLNDAAWNNEQSNLNESPAVISPATPRKYYQIEVDE